MRTTATRTQEARKIKTHRFLSTGGDVIRYRGTLPEARRYAAYLAGKIDPTRVRNPR